MRLLSLLPLAAAVELYCNVPGASNYDPSEHATHRERACCRVRLQMYKA